MCKLQSVVFGHSCRKHLIRPCLPWSLNLIVPPLPSPALPQLQNIAENYLLQPDEVYWSHSW